MSAIFAGIIVAGALGILALAVAGLIYIAYKTYEPTAETRHTRDCMALNRTGLTDSQCLAPHPTDYFVSPRDHAEFEADLDWQIQIGKNR